MELALICFSSAGDWRKERKEKRVRLKSPEDGTKKGEMKERQEEEREEVMTRKLESWKNKY